MATDESLKSEGPSTEGSGAEGRVAADKKADELVDDLEQRGRFTGYSGAAGRHGTNGAQGGGFSANGAQSGGNQANDALPDMQVVSLHDGSGHDGPAFGSEAEGEGDDAAPSDPPALIPGGRTSGG